MNQAKEIRQPFPRIVFMGTPEFAVASLDALVREGFHVVAVVTAPDKPAGRGMHLHQSAVKKYAIEHNIPVLQPEKLKNPEFLEVLRSYDADLQVVVAFRMLPEVVWNMPPMGTINVHGSLLPQYRGAAPINWAVINGESETGVTTFKLKHEIDTGDLLMQARMPIGPDETAGEIHDRMKELGAQLLVQTVTGLTKGDISPIPQAIPADGLKHAPKIFTETCKINTAKTALEVHNLVRGLSPFPGAFTTLDGKMLKVYQCAVTADIPAPLVPGTWFTDNKQRLSLCCNDGWVDLLEVQLEGKKRMKTEDFIRGHKHLF
ncbi:MAG: methionyl-tRNA formyltransferase, partial [Chitinophagaceae bacterium]|nr:methionyl-tRNA formyltransferase [Chitinophagaceae bacterium]